MAAVCTGDAGLFAAAVLGRDIHEFVTTLDGVLGVMCGSAAPCSLTPGNITELCISGDIKPLGDSPADLGGRVRAGGGVSTEITKSAGALPAFASRLCMRTPGSAVDARGCVPWTLLLTCTLPSGSRGAGASHALCPGGTTELVVGAALGCIALPPRFPAFAFPRAFPVFAGAETVNDAGCAFASTAADCCSMPRARVAA
jgi:hypothetical protein